MSRPGSTTGPAPAGSPFDLTGRHIVVTGGGRGIGRAIAESAAKAGAMVTIVSRSRDELERTAAGIGGEGRRCEVRTADLSVTDALPDLVAEIASVAPIDGVVHAAGVQLRKPAVEITLRDWRFVQQTNTEAPFFLSTAIARTQLADHRPGSHVFVGSLNSSIGLPRIAPYVASKTALLGITRALATEWAGDRIRANIIGPGYFHTALTDDLLAHEQDRARILGRIPMRRLGDPREVGDAAVFLLSDASRYMTGQLLNVDGGWLAS